MKSCHPSRLASAGLRGLLASLFALVCAAGFAQTQTLSEIQTVLRAQTPTACDAAQRETGISNLDLYLKNDASRTDPDMIAFYEAMMGYAASEMDQPTT